MSIRTKNRAKLGIIEFYASVTYLHPLQDPDEFGNWGLQGYDQEIDTTQHTSMEDAKAHCEKLAAEKLDVSTFNIDRITYTAYEFPFEGQVVLDAETETLGTTYGWVNEINHVEWDEEYKP